MLSATVDLRLSDGGKNIAVNRVGQTITIEVWAVIKGSNTSSADDGFQSFLGSFLSGNTLGGSVRGHFTETLRAPFNALASQTGTSQDLDCDGDADLGSNDNFDGKALSCVRAGGVNKEGQALSGVVAGGATGKQFHVADLTFTVDKLLATKSATTELNFRPRTKPLQGVWIEDGKAFGLGLEVGKPVVLTSAATTSGTNTTTNTTKAPAKAPTTPTFSSTPIRRSATLDALK